MKFRQSLWFLESMYLGSLFNPSPLQDIITDDDDDIIYSQVSIPGDINVFLTPPCTPLDKCGRLILSYNHGKHEQAVLFQLGLPYGLKMTMKSINIYYTILSILYQIL